MIRKLLAVAAVLFYCLPNGYAQANDFVTRKNAHFIIAGKPYYYVGANYWQGAYLPINGNETLNRKRVLQELDFMKANGVTNLRILAATEGTGFVNAVDRTRPALQPGKAVFDEQQLRGLDFLLDAMRLRKMKAVLFLSNNWEWSGGFLQYVNWYDDLPDSIMKRKLNWDEQRDYTSKFYSCEPCKKDYLEQVDLILGHTNIYSGIAYKNDPAIMAWEIANEPRPMRPAANKNYATWISNVAAHIKQKDPNHLLTIGVEGEMGTESLPLYKDIHADNNVDYLTIHIWPKNWGWFSDTSISKSFDKVIENTNSYIKKHVAIARELNKPLVLEEFGLPRDGHSFAQNSTTRFRDQYYQLYVDRVSKSAASDDVIAGLNFWSVAGLYQQKAGQLFWKPGDDYMGDPPAEEQGLNSVFNSDASTWKVIRAGYEAISKTDHAINTPVDVCATKETKALYNNLFQLMDKGIMFGHQDDLAYGVGWKYKEGKSDVREVTGDYPAVYGWELGRLELDWKHNLDSVPFDRMKVYIKTIHHRGGVITISWHLNNPLTGKTSWDPAEGTVASILPGGKKHDLYKSWLDKIAKFMNDLLDENGNPIPVIFRPFHELNGDWFWWGGNHCTADEFKSLWKFTVSYLRDEKHLHHLLYAYNTDKFQTREEYLLKYPGDDWVDMIGFDIYQRENGDKANQEFTNDMSSMLTILEQIAAEKNKLPAVTEFGYGQVPDDNWWTQTLWKALQHHKISYVLAWRNAGLKLSGENEYYIPYNGQRSAADFKKFYQLPRTLFQRDLLHEKLYQ